MFPDFLVNVKTKRPAAYSLYRLCGWALHLSSVNHALIDKLVIWLFINLFARHQCLKRLLFGESRLETSYYSRVKACVI